MALPTVNSLLDCVNFSRTISPFLHQLSFDYVSALRFSSFSDWYINTNPAISAAIFCFLLSTACFILQEANQNASQVDRLWSIIPVIYVGHFTYYAHLVGGDTQRLDTLCTFVLLWGIRLTFNYWRKGGYQIGHQDYRQIVLKEKIPQPFYVLFSCGFLAFTQNIILFAISLPAYVFLLIGKLPAFAAPESFTTTDAVISQSLACLLLIEALADQQQWNYQIAKSSYQKAGVVPQGFNKEDLDRGFVVTGLWSYSRHPNFTCEQLIWVGIYQWTCATTDVIYHWGGLGALVLCALFQGSTVFTENITSWKYKEYKEYQTMVGRFFPKMGGGGLDFHGDEKKE